MCQLIEHPKEILPFYGVLKKNLELLSETISDPEARKVSARALNTLKGSCSGSENISFMKTSEDFSKLIPANPENIQYLSILITNLCNSGYLEESVWKDIFNNYGPEANSSLESTLKYAKDLFVVKGDDFEDTEEGKDLYRGEFSLAYGALTLLNNTKLHLKQNLSLIHI